MNSNREFEILREINSIPTAPFCEELIASYITNWAHNLELDLKIDSTGNLYVTYRFDNKRQSCNNDESANNTGFANDTKPANDTEPVNDMKVCDETHWVLAAHMDHPGFEAISQENEFVSAVFRGGVKEEFFAGSEVTFFSEGQKVHGTIEGVERDSVTKWFNCRIFVGEEKVVSGSTGMWKLPPFSIEDNIVSASACDDLAGVAAIMRVLEELKEENSYCHCTALFTRAEEVGFVGAVGVCKAQILGSNVHIIAVETSKVQLEANLGDGVVVRVGDKTSVFSTELTDYVSMLATVLIAKDEDFASVRRLMPGGTCESSVYCGAGFSATGLCLPLGNYHNMGSENSIDSEQVAFSDYLSLIKLMRAVVTFDSSPQKRAEKWLNTVYSKYDSMAEYL